MVRLGKLTLSLPSNNFEINLFVLLQTTEVVVGGKMGLGFRVQPWNNILFNKIKRMHLIDWLTHPPSSPQNKTPEKKGTPKKGKKIKKNKKKRGLKTSKAQHKVFRIHFDMDTYEIHIPYSRRKYLIHIYVRILRPLNTWLLWIFRILFDLGTY